MAKKRKKRKTKKKGRVMKRIVIDGEPAKRGARMTGGMGWRLATVKGRKRIFVGTFSVPK